MKALSIIVPAYNVEHYIEKCLSSLVENEEIIDSLDILVINDGSTDGTQAKVKKYVERYPNSIRLINKKNGGHGSGINKGIELMQGKYFKVLDSDDWFDNKGLCRLVKLIESGINYDMILSPYYEIWENKTSPISVWYNIFKDKSEVTFDDLNRNKLTASLQVITLKSRIFQENISRKIDEKISYDDVEYYLFPIPYIESCYYINEYIYNYRLGLDTQSVNSDVFQRRRNMHYKVIETLIEYYNYNKNLFSNSARLYYHKNVAREIEINSNLILKSNEKNSKNNMKLLLELSTKLNGIVLNKKLTFLKITKCRLYDIVKFVYRIKNKHF
jgi:glycosyltransferase involved in cell wall biosynthesis